VGFLCFENRQSAIRIRTQEGRFASYDETSLHLRQAAGGKPRLWLPICIRRAALENTKSTSKTASAVRSASRSFFRSVAFTSLLLRKQLWIWPILAALILGLCGWWVSRSVENAMRERRIDELNTILQADITALRIWMVEQGVDANFIAKDDGILPMVESLLKTAKDSSSVERALMQSKAQDELRAYLKPELESGNYSGFFLISPEGVILAADVNTPIGKRPPGYQGEFFKSVLEGSPSVQSHFPVFCCCAMRMAN
jgi:hypothetical protein